MAPVLPGILFFSMPYPVLGISNLYAYVYCKTIDLLFYRHSFYIDYLEHNVHLRSENFEVFTMDLILSIALG